MGAGDGGREDTWCSDGTATVEALRQAGKIGDGPSRELGGGCMLSGRRTQYIHKLDALSPESVSD